MTLRILQVLAAPYPTRQGSQVYVQGMVRALARRGHDVVLACYGHGDPTMAPDPQARLLRIPPMPRYDRLRSGPDGVKPWLDGALAWKVLGASRGTHVLHAHNYEGALVSWLARGVRRIPLVYSAHTTLGDELPAYFGGALARRAAARAGRALDLTVPRGADVALGLSPSGCRALRELGCGRVVLAPPGVDLEDLEGADPGRVRSLYRLDGRPWVVYAGNPDRYQDLDLLVAAMARIPDAGLLMISASPLDTWREACLLAGMGPQRIRTVTSSDWSLTRDLIRAGDVGCVPRTTCSGFPMKLLNFLGLGVPVVAVRGVGGDLPGTLAVEGGSVQALEAGIRTLLAEPERARHLGARGREAVARDWTWDARARDLEQVYLSLVEERAP